LLYSPEIKAKVCHIDRNILIGDDIFRRVLEEVVPFTPPQTVDQHTIALIKPPNFGYSSLQNLLGLEGLAEAAGNLK